MAAKYILVLLFVVNLMVMSPSARLKPKAAVIAKQAGVCHWGQERCCCDSTQCKKFATGLVGHWPDRQEACDCSDSIVKEMLGMSERDDVHPPSSLDEYALCQKATIEFGVKGDAGACTYDRLFELAREERKIDCIKKMENSTMRHWEKLSRSFLLRSFNKYIDISTLMGCAQIQQSCSTSLKSTAINFALGNLETAVVGNALKGNVMKKAQAMLVKETGIDENVAKELMDWAFYHEEGANPYCDAAKLAGRREMLLRGLTAEEPDHVMEDVPWKYGDEVLGPFKEVLQAAIDGMLPADCPKSEAHQVEPQANIPEGDLYDDSILGRITKFAESFPMLNTTLQYMEFPDSDNKIEGDEIGLVRLILKTLTELLENDNFMRNLKRHGQLDNWTMPPELDGLWKKTRNAKYGERIWPDELLDELRKAQSPNVGCDCDIISPALGVHLLNLLPKIGLDFGNVSSTLNGTLLSDKQTETLQHVDLIEFANTMTMVEAGISDPVFAVKYVTNVLLSAGEKSGNESGIPDVSAAAKMKGVLVGMPIFQNLWLALDEKSSPEVFAKKMKWFFVVNIAWAVWHAIEKPLPPEDVVLGLLTLAYSALSSFSYEGKSLVFSNSKEFTEQMLAVYTVWNYRFVQRWASKGDPKDQWMHASVALSMPIIQSIINHGDARHYINYRRDGLFHSMLLMLQQQ